MTDKLHEYDLTIKFPWATRLKHVFSPTEPNWTGTAEAYVLPSESS